MIAFSVAVNNINKMINFYTTLMKQSLIYDQSDCVVLTIVNIN